jgi:hypothetical protein
MNLMLRTTNEKPDLTKLIESIPRIKEIKSYIKDRDIDSLHKIFEIPDEYIDLEKISVNIYFIPFAKDDGIKFLEKEFDFSTKNNIIIDFGKKNLKDLIQINKLEKYKNDILKISRESEIEQVFNDIKSNIKKNTLNNINILFTINIDGELFYILIKNTSQIFVHLNGDKDYIKNFYEPFLGIEKSFLYYLELILTKNITINDLQITSILWILNYKIYYNILNNNIFKQFKKFDDDEIKKKIVLNRKEYLNNFLKIYQKCDNKDIPVSDDFLQKLPEIKYDNIFKNEDEGSDKSVSDILYYVNIKQKNEYDTKSQEDKDKTPYNKFMKFIVKILYYGLYKELLFDNIDDTSIQIIAENKKPHKIEVKTLNTGENGNTIRNELDTLRNSLNTIRKIGLNRVTSNVQLTENQRPIEIESTSTTSTTSNKKFASTQTSSNFKELEKIFDQNPQINSTKNQTIKVGKTLQERKKELFINSNGLIYGGSKNKYQLFISKNNKYFIIYNDKKIYLKLSNIITKNNKLFVKVNRNKNLLRVHWK